MPYHNGTKLAQQRCGINNSHAGGGGSGGIGGAGSSMETIAAVLAGALCAGSGSGGSGSGTGGDSGGMVTASPAPAFLDGSGYAGIAAGLLVASFTPHILVMNAVKYCVPFSFHSVLKPACVRACVRVNGCYCWRACDRVPLLWQSFHRKSM